MDSPDNSTERADRLTIRLLESPPEVVIVLTGELDFANADRLSAVINRVLDSEQPVRRLTVECGELQFVDSAGMDCLLTARRRLRERGGQLTFRRPSHALRRLLALTADDEAKQP